VSAMSREIPVSDHPIVHTDSGVGVAAPERSGGYPFWRADHDSGVGVAAPKRDLHREFVAYQTVTRRG